MLPMSMSLLRLQPNSIVLSEPGLSACRQRRRQGKRSVLSIWERLENPRPLAEIWAADHLERASEAAMFCSFLERQYQDLRNHDWGRAYSIAIQGEYGLGKTTFLEGLAENLARNHPVAWVNAWLDDTVDDPFTSLMVVLERALASVSRKGKIEKVRSASVAVAGALAKGALKKGLSLVTDSETASEVVQMLGEGGAGVIDSLADAIAKEQKKDYVTRVDAIVRLKTALGEVLSEIDKDPDHYLPLYIFVDELDRCRPTYAIRMLETVKHLLDVPGLVFILGVQRDQLAAAVQGQYGPAFDGHSYLRRFIDRSYELASPSLERLCGHYIEKFHIPVARLSAPPGASTEPQILKLASKHIAQWIRYYGCTARDVVPVIDMLKTFTTILDDKYPVELSLCVPLFLQRITHGRTDPLKINPPNRPACTELVDFRKNDSTTIVQTWEAQSYLLGKNYDTVFDGACPQDPVARWAFQRVHAEVPNGYKPNGMPITNQYAKLAGVVARLTDNSQSPDSS